MPVRSMRSARSTGCAELRAAARALWQGADALLLPTAGTHYSIDEEQAEPLQLNSNLGRYTNFVNLMDLAAVAVPAGFTRGGLPFGVTLIGTCLAGRRPADASAGRLHPAGATARRHGAATAANPARCRAPQRAASMWPSAART